MTKQTFRIKATQQIVEIRTNGKSRHVKFGGGIFEIGSKALPSYVRAAIAEFLAK